MSDATWTVTVPIAKIDEVEKLVFGWANVPHPVTKDGHLGTPKTDQQDDQIYLDDLEKAAYEYVEIYGDGDIMHTADVEATLVESMVFTPDKMEKMGIDWPGNWGWWVGYRVSDAAFEGVKSGKLKMLSIGGTAKQVEVT